MILKYRPPVTVLVVCIFELLGLFLLPAALFKETTKAIGLWYQLYIVFTGFVSAAIIWYLWRMRRIGLYLYFASYTVHNIVALIAGNWLVYVIVIPLVGALFLLPHVKKMTIVRKDVAGPATLQETGRLEV